MLVWDGTGPCIFHKRRDRGCFPAQQFQIEQLLRVVPIQCDELAALKGSESELRQKLALVEELTRQAQTVAAQLDKLPKTSGDGSPRRKHRTSSGPTEQPALPAVEQICESCRRQDVPELRRRAGAHEGQFETSEMIDVVEVSYRVVQRSTPSERRRVRRGQLGSAHALPR